MNTIIVNNTVEALIQQWNEAKNNEKGWLEVRRNVEKDLLSELQERLNEISAGLQGTANLTTGVSLVGKDTRTLMKVTIGEDLKLDPVGLADFLDKYPNLLGVICKVRMEPVTVAILNKLLVDDEMSKDLETACVFKEKTPSFSGVA